MSKYTEAEHNVILDTDKASQSWKEDKRWNGSNHISVATGSQWEHETLHRSAKGRFWIEHTSQRQGSTDFAKILEPREAAAWLIANDHELPKDLAALEDEVSE